jgi:hypothetical protein
MKHKYGKWYADWRDEHGQRKAKAFRTKKAALKFSRKMQADAAAKKAPASARSRRSSKRGPRPTHRVARAASSRAKSPRSTATSAPTS